MGVVEPLYVDGGGDQCFDERYVAKVSDCSKVLTTSPCGFLNAYLGMVA